MAILLDVNRCSRSVFYYHRKRINDEDNTQLRRRDCTHYYLHKGTYGYQRITA